MIHLALTDFAAVTPGVVSPDGWKSWAATGVKPAEEAVPACPVPAMMKRRMTPLGRLALTALADVKPRQEEAVVFASSWGDNGRTHALLADMTADATGVSPAGFSSSVHNGVAAVAAIWLKNHHVASAVSGGDLTTEAGLSECVLALADSADSVILVRYEEPLPADWNTPCRRIATPAVPYAWAARFVRPDAAPAGTLTVELTQLARKPDDARCDTAVTGACPADIAFLLGEKSGREHTDASGRGWRWTKRVNQ